MCVLLLLVEVMNDGCIVMGGRGGFGVGCAGRKGVDGVSNVVIVNNNSSGINVVIAVVIIIAVVIVIVIVEWITLLAGIIIINSRRSTIIPIATRPTCDASRHVTSTTTTRTTATHAVKLFHEIRLTLPRQMANGLDLLLDLTQLQQSVFKLELC